MTTIPDYDCLGYPFQLSTRQPFQAQIVDNVGFGFTTGLMVHSLHGFFSNSAKGGGGGGCRERLIWSFRAVRMNSPRIAGRWANWCALFTGFECSLASIRQKDDAWGMILSAAATGGLLGIRRGFRFASFSAIFDGFCIGFLEGALFLSENVVRSSRQQREEVIRSSREQREEVEISPVSLRPIAAISRPVEPSSGRVMFLPSQKHRPLESFYLGHMYSYPFGGLFALNAGKNQHLHLESKNHVSSFASGKHVNCLPRVQSWGRQGFFPSASAKRFNIQE